MHAMHATMAPFGGCTRALCLASRATYTTSPPPRASLLQTKTAVKYLQHTTQQAVYIPASSRVESKWEMEENNRTTTTRRRNVNVSSVMLSLFLLFFINHYLLFLLFWVLDIASGYIDGLIDDEDVLTFLTFSLISLPEVTKQAVTKKLKFSSR